MKRVALLSILLCLVSACGGPADEEVAAPLFTQLSAAETGVAFTNRIEERDGFNVLEYEYFYNGGGVAAGDVNGDGLPDLYFSANIDQDRLYFNRGGLAFEDVTEQAGLVSESGWTTGVTMGDVNGDGYLDIYVCKSGRVSTDRRRNALYVNNGDGTFTESVRSFLTHTSYSSMGADIADINNDALPDIVTLDMLAEYPNIYRNESGVAFADKTRDWGVGEASFSNGAAYADLDDDGDLDLVVNNINAEAVANPENYNAVVSRQGPDEFTTRMWWDK